MAPEVVKKRRYVSRMKPLEVFKSWEDSLDRTSAGITEMRAEWGLVGEQVTKIRQRVTEVKEKFLGLPKEKQHRDSLRSILDEYMDAPINQW